MKNDAVIRYSPCVYCGDLIDRSLDPWVFDQDQGFVCSYCAEAERPYSLWIPALIGAILGTGIAMWWILTH
jgi:hypothetical protein